MSDFTIFAQEIQTDDLMNLFDAMKANPANKLPEVITILTGEEYADVTSMKHDVSKNQVEVELSYYTLNFKMVFNATDELEVLDQDDEEE